MGSSVNRSFSFYRIRRAKGVNLIRQEGKYVRTWSCICLKITLNLKNALHRTYYSKFQNCGESDTGSDTKFCWVILLTYWSSQLCCRYSDWDTQKFPAGFSLQVSSRGTETLPLPLLAPQEKDNKVCLFLRIINGRWLALMDDTRGKTPLDMTDHCTDRCQDRFAD